MIKLLFLFRSFSFLFFFSFSGFGDRCRCKYCKLLLKILVVIIYVHMIWGRSKNVSVAQYLCLLHLSLIFECLTSNISQCTEYKCMLVQSASYCMVCASVRAIIHSLKLVDYLLVQAHKPCNNLYLMME